MAKGLQNMFARCSFRASTHRRTASLVRKGRSACNYSTLQRAAISPLDTTCLAKSVVLNDVTNVRQQEVHQKPFPKRTHTLTLDTINQDIRKMEYAVKGPLVIRAGEIEKELAQGQKKPFDSVIRANIGDCHAMGQETITYPRQVMSLCLHKALFSDPSIPSDAKDHARRILASCQGESMGSYTDSAGMQVVRRDVADYIAERDGFPCDPENIILTAGAGEGIKNCLELIRNTTGKKAGVMIPIPQYPLYTASIAQYGLHGINYYLNEGKDWALDIEDLKQSVTAARQHCDPKVICVLNPGNPTGQVLTKENIQNIIRFAYSENLVIMADEVYQENIYAEGHEFHSFRKVLHEMGPPFDNVVELISFHSASKGYMGECGIRAGYLEATNLQPIVFAQLVKTFIFCNTTAGQAKLPEIVLSQGNTQVAKKCMATAVFEWHDAACIDCIVRRPKPGNSSYELFNRERSAVLSSLAERAKLVEELLNDIPGIHCNQVQGAMYAFPRLDLPEKVVAKAQDLDKTPDWYYTMRLLEETGICILPGSGFGQRPGTYHFRTTILPPKDMLVDMLRRLKQFHRKFLETET